MKVSSVWDELAVAVNSYEEGDVLAVASWIGLLDQAQASAGEAEREKIGLLSADLRRALKSGKLDGLVERLGSELDSISAGLQTVPSAEPASHDDLWVLHGPGFISETKNRLARAEEITLLLEENADPELVGELFRVFHTIKGEAGFLHREDLSVMAHGTEELLEALRSGKLAWDGQVADRVLGGIDALKGAIAQRGQSSSSQSAHRQEEILRVPASKIDALISQIGELLIAQESDSSGQQSVKKLSRSLQQSALRLRTEPVGELMNRLKRGARDLGRSLGKDLEVVLGGQDLEIDRTLISSLEEPLMHLIRNAIDHGLEPAEVRAAAGKPAEAHLTIEAQRRGNQIVISIADDGKGLDSKKIWAKGVEKGLVSGPLPPDLRTVHELIFRPGFSTADRLSEVSGRGVGMDIVASSVRAARGHVDVSTQPGQGTRVSMTFPLSTAVLDALVVGLGQRKFLIPVHSVLESMMVDPATVTTLATGARVLSLRGEPLEVFSLREALDSVTDSAPVSWGVVTQTSKGDRQVLLVDLVESKKEVVIRSLGRLFQSLQGVSAAAVLAGGTPALVLDIDQLVGLARRAS